MKVIRSRAEAQWLPSRHHLAIFRLAAFVRLWHARPRAGNVLLAVELLGLLRSRSLHDVALGVVLGGDAALGHPGAGTGEKHPDGQGPAHHQFISLEKGGDLPDQEHLDHHNQQL